MAKDWTDIFMDEDAPEQPKVDLPSENEAEGEDNGAGSEAAGALSEDGNSEGIKEVPEGEDVITGTKSTEYDDVFAFLDEDDAAKEDKPAEGGDEKPADEGDDKDGEEKGDDEKGDAADKKKKAAKKRRNAYSFLFDEDAPEQPKVDLPSENEKEGEDNGAGSEAAGALSEDGDDEGIKDVPEGTDVITGTKSTEYDDIFAFMDEGEGSEEQPEDNDEANGDEDGTAGDEGAQGGEASDKKKKAAKKRRNEWSIFDEDDETKGDDEGEKPAEGDDKPAEGEAEGEEGDKDCGGSKKRKKVRRNEYAFLFDEGDDAEGDDKGGDAEEGEKPADEGDDEEKPAEGGSDKKKKAAKKRRNFWEDEGDDEGSDDDNASEKAPVKAPEGEGEGEEGSSKEEEATTDWAHFFDEAGVEDPENLPGDTSAPDPVDQNGKDVDPNGDPDLPKNLTEPVVQPVETENGNLDPITNRRHISDRYFFN